MSSLQNNLGALAQGLGRLFAVPITALLILVAGVLGAFAILITVAIVTSATSTFWTIFLIAAWALLALPAALLALRGRRWLRTTSDLGTEHQVVLPGPSQSTDLEPVDLTTRVQEDMRGKPGEDDVRSLFDAVTESRAPGSTRGAGGRVTRVFSIGRLSPVGRVLAKVEQGQRALLTAAGGPVAAPYLKDDLRITVLSLIATLIVLPIGVLSTIILGLVLLTQ